MKTINADMKIEPLEIEIDGILTRLQVQFRFAQDLELRLWNITQFAEQLKKYSMVLSHEMIDKLFDFIMKIHENTRFIFTNEEHAPIQKLFNFENFSMVEGLDFFSELSTEELLTILTKYVQSEFSVSQMMMSIVQKKESHKFSDISNLSFDADNSVVLGFIEKEMIIMSPNKQYGTWNAPGIFQYGNALFMINSSYEHVYYSNETILMNKTNGVFIAKQSGVVVYGNNWIALVPLQYPIYSFEISRDKAMFLMNIFAIPNNIHDFLPEYEIIVAYATQKKYGLDFVVNQAEYEHNILRCIEEKKSHQIDSAQMLLCSEAESDIELILTEDNTRAEIYLKKGRGFSKQLKLVDIQKTIEEAHLIRLAQSLKRDLKEFYFSFMMEATILVAKGKPVTENKDIIHGFLIEGHYFSETEVIDIQGRYLERIQLGMIPDNIDFSVTDIAWVIQFSPGTVVKQFNKDTLEGYDVYGNILQPKYPIKQLGTYHNLQYDAEKRELQASFTEPGLLLLCNKNETIDFIALPCIDSVLNVEISLDLLHAYVSYEPAVGVGKFLMPEVVDHILQEHNIVTGIIEKNKQNLLYHIKDNTQVHHLLIAKGQVIEYGTAEQLHFYVQLATGAKMMLKDDGTVDYKNQNLFTQVKKDKVLATILPPEVFPKQGFTVTGVYTEEPPLMTVELELGDGVRREDNEDYGYKIISTKSGRLEYIESVDEKNGFINVNDLYVINGGIGYETGNIRYHGDVVVDGDVEAGFFIISYKNIQINGNVEAALISAQGALHVDGGVKGRQKGVLRAKDILTVQFFEQAIGLAVGNFIIRDSCFRSFIKCNGLVILPNDGRIIGGNIKSRLGIRAFIVGSPNGINTTLSFGQNYLIEDQIAVLEKRVDELNNKIIEIDSEIKLLRRLQREQELTIIAVDKRVAMRKVMRYNQKLFALREKYELEKNVNASIMIFGTIYPGVIIESHGRELHIKKEKQRMMYKFDYQEGKIIEKVIPADCAMEDVLEEENNQIDSQNLDNFNDTIPNI